MIVFKVEMLIPGLDIKLHGANDKEQARSPNCWGTGDLQQTYQGNP